MKFHLAGAQEKQMLSLQSIVGLFYEADQCLFVSAADEADISIRLDTSERLNEAVTVAALTDRQGEQIERKCVRSFHDADEKEKSRLKKQTVLVALLEVLQAYTGLHQPWGILTGIRPTKLMHRCFQNGWSAEQAKAHLASRYLIDEAKLDLMQTIVSHQQQALPDLYDLKNEVSIYIGIPFCPTKCAYCTFPAYAIGGRQGSVNGFLYGLHYEMEHIGEWLKAREIDITTIYFGGGTPTSITADEMDRLYDAMTQHFPNIDRVREITVEAGRPDTITSEKLRVLNKWGIDRISINPQSYKQETLDAIGRHHTVKETIEKFHLARSMGMNNINMDLIIGLPGEGIEDFAHTLAETEKLMPESLTVHTLSFKRASQMTKQREKYKVADRGEAAQMMQMANDWTNSHGYHPYYLYRQKNILGNLENIGYALPGQDSLYNMIIMEEMQTIIGIGCGAASKWVDPHTGKISRYANPKEPKAYNESFQTCTKAKIEALEQLFSGRPAAKS